MLYLNTHHSYFTRISTKMEYKDRKKVQERENFHVFRENTLTRECLWTKIRALGNVIQIKNLEVMKMKFTSTDKAPAALGPYSQAVSVNGLLFTSGQIALDPATGEIVGSDVQAQAEQVCKNLAAVLEANGLTFTDAVKTTCFLADMGDFAAFNEVYGKYFTGKPARSCVAVKTLPKNVLCEVEVIAEMK